MTKAQSIAIGVAIAAGLLSMAIALFAARRAGPRVTIIESRREEDE